MSRAAAFPFFSADRWQSGCVGSPWKQPLLAPSRSDQVKNPGLILWLSSLCVSPPPPTQKVIMSWNKQLFARLSGDFCWNWLFHPWWKSGAGLQKRWGGTVSCCWTRWSPPVSGVFVFKRPGLSQEPGSQAQVYRGSWTSSADGRREERKIVLSFLWVLSDPENPQTSERFSVESSCLFTSRGAILGALETQRQIQDTPERLALPFSPGMSWIVLEELVWAEGRCCCCSFTSSPPSFLSLS